MLNCVDKNVELLDKSVELCGEKSGELWAKVLNCVDKSELMDKSVELCGEKNVVDCVGESVETCGQKC